MASNQNTPNVHNQMLLEGYHSLLPLYERMAEAVPQYIEKELSAAGIIVASLEKRVKSEPSLIGKLELKGYKYNDILDITDILGIRVVTFYLDDVDKVASLIERSLEIDWENSIDKRKAHEIDSFGYLSLHYVCRIPEATYHDPENPQINQIKFEVQMRTLLQHAWANMNHDTGYKSGVEVPDEYIRNLSRLAGILELVDEQFSHIRSEITDYRRKIHMLVANGNLDEVPLDGDSFRSYLEMDPFGPLNRKIASVNQAEIQEVSVMPYLKVFKHLGCKSLGDVSRLIYDYGEGAYQIACYQIALTDIDIISSTLAPQNICIAYMLKSGMGKSGIKMVLETLNGPSESNDTIAEMIEMQAGYLPFMNQ